MRLWTLLILVLIAIPCCRAEAQVKLSKQDVVIYSGLTDLRVIDGLVVADASSKPTASPAAIISVEFAKSYKIFDLEAETQAGEFVNVDQLSDKTYILKNPGVYKLLGTAYDPENGLAKHRLSVTVGGVVPVPPGPTPVPDDLQGLSADARRIMAAFVQGMAADMDFASKEIAAGKLKTMIEVADVTEPRDKQTRIIFKQQMAGILEPRLGSETLRPDAAKVFHEVAIGFGSVR